MPFRGRVITITNPDEPNAPEGQSATNLNGLRFIPRQPRQIIHEKDIESACLGIVQQPLVAGTVGSAPGDGLVLIAVRDPPALALSGSFTGAKLVRNRGFPVGVQMNTGNTARRASNPPFRPWFTHPMLIGHPGHMQVPSPWLWKEIPGKLPSRGHF